MYSRIFAVCLLFAGGILADHRHDAGLSQANGTATGTRRESPSHSLPITVVPHGIALPKDNTTDDDTSSARCGKRYGSCPDGLCCSARGFCGTGPAHCGAPDCQYLYSNGCDSLKTPGGKDTSALARDQIGDVPYGAFLISQCNVPYTISLTYDDGPYFYTTDLLDLLDSYGAKATFFVTAINGNKGAIDDENYPWPGILRRMYEDNHQIASHTWSHQDLDKMPTRRRRSQMIKNEMAIRNVLGVFPTYMRPPYMSCTVESGCLRDMEDLGYHVTSFDVETNDWRHDSPDLIQRSKDVFNDALARVRPTGQPLLIIAHDVHEQSVYNLTEHMLDAISETNHVPVTLGECLGDPPSNWYRSAKRRAGGRHRFGKGLSHDRNRTGFFRPWSTDATKGDEDICDDEGDACIDEDD